MAIVSWEDKEAVVRSNDREDKELELRTCRVQDSFK